MNIEHIREVLTCEYGEITAHGEQIFKVTRRHNSRPLGVYFFDCTNYLGKTDFDLDTYQEGLLAQEFYRKRASLQWNIYLYFLCEESVYNDLLKSGRISEIESNREYARKYVITEDRLATELVPQKELVAEGKPGVPTDVSLRWIERLRERDLDGAFIKSAAYTQVVELYLQGNPIKEKSEDIHDTSSMASASMSFIKRLELKHYRPYPTEPVFQFGASNLIRGVNGSGKTSLLEAIELWICGKTYRNPVEGASSIKVGVQFIGNGKLEWNDSRNNALFRARDLSWYGNHYPKGNRLHLGFNRFNFYDSDAATRITEFAKEPEVTDAISSIMLGPEVNVIEERLNALLTRFRQEQSSTNKEIEHAKATIKEAKQEIKELGSTPEKEGEIYRRFIEELVMLNWLGQMPEDNKVSLNEFLLELDHVAVTVDTLRRELDWASSWSLATMTSERQNLEELLEKLEKIGETIEDRKNSVSVLTKDIVKSTSNLSELEKLKPYVLEVNSQKLLGLGKAISENDRMEARLASVIDALEQINMEEYRNIDESFGAYEENFTQQIALLQAEISKLQTYVNEIQDRQGRIASLAAEIRSKGRALLEEKTVTKKCPLCGANYEIGELAKRIDEVSAEVGESEFLKNALASLSALERQIRGTKKEYEKLEKLRYAVSLRLDISDPSEMKLTDVVNSLAAVEDQLNTLKRKSAELATLRDRLEAQGLTEENYRSIGEWYMETYCQPIPDYSRRDEFKKILTAEESTLQEQKRVLQKTQKDIDTDQEKAQLLIKQYSGQSPEGLSDLSGVRNRYELIRDASQKCEATLRKIAASDDETFSDLSLRLSEIRTTHERFSAAKKQIEESAHIKAKNEGKIKKAQSIIDKLIPRKERADIAITTIEDILQHDSKEKHVQNFLRENLQEIVRVFRMMHTPREFSDLEFDSSTGALGLVRRGGQRISGVTEISSGQRAALSLSIFLVLNGKLSNGPPFIILDDPLAHVDDLNILSFFDYLRELIISGNRQLFFATASEKVANLYRKKFDFLENEFCDTLLTRLPA